jgi:hypothetical protein
MPALPIIIHEAQGGNPAINAWAATDTDADSIYDVENLNDYRAYTRWKALNFTGDKFVTGDWTTVPGGTIVVDSIALIGHNFATAETDLSIEVFEGSWVDAGPGVFTATVDNEIIVKLVSPAKTDDSFRLKMANSTATPELGVFLIGQKLEFPRYLQGGWDPEGQRVEADQPLSQAGEILGTSIKFKEHNLQAQFTRLTDTFIRDTYMPVWDSHLSLLKPFVFSWNPTGVTLAESRYVALTPGAQLQVPYDPIRQALSLRMRGVVRP